MGSTWEDVPRPRSRQGLGPDYSLQLIPAVWEPPSAVGSLVTLLLGLQIPLHNPSPQHPLWDPSFPLTSL